MRSGLLAVLAVLVAATPAAAAPCTKTAEGPEATIEQRGIYDGRVARSSVTICRTRTGRTRVIRARIVRSPKRRARGRFLSAAAASATELAYVDARIGRGGRDSIVVTVLDMQTLRLARRVTFARGRGVSNDFPEVALADDGSIAVGVQEAWLRLARPGGRPIPINEGFVGGLRFEDGVTLAWGTFYGKAARFVDLATPPLQDGCPARSAFREATRTERLTVSGTGAAVRVCDRTTGLDPVVAAYDQSAEGNSTDVLAVGAAGPVAVVGVNENFKGQGCLRSSVLVFDATAGRVVREVKGGSCAWVPAAPGPLVVAPSGAPAWVATPRSDGSEKVDRLAAVDGETLRELDKGPPGSITDLRPTADGVAWRSGGVEKSSTLR